MIHDPDELAQIRNEQRQALALLHGGHPEQRGLRLALNDWFAEEILMLPGLDAHLDAEGRV